MKNLTAYPDLPHRLNDVSLKADARIIQGGNLRKIFLQYEVSGAIQKILWPKGNKISTRQDKLWERSCFEAFIQPIGQNRYWEINLSPSGDWNVYRFDSYRKGMITELSVSSIKSILKEEPDKKMLSCELWLPEWNNVSAFKVGLTTVIETVTGEISYWAIAHSGNQPDFHLAESFSLHLE